MPTKLEIDGKVRNVRAIAWAAWEPPNPWDRAISYVLAYGAELLQSVATESPYELNDKRTRTIKVGTRRVVEDRWVPERGNRLFLPRIPEPLYQPEDVEFLRAAGNFVLLKSERERDAYVGRVRQVREAAVAAEAEAQRERMMASYKAAQDRAERVTQGVV